MTTTFTIFATENNALSLGVGDITNEIDVSALGLPLYDIDANVVDTADSNIVLGIEFKLCYDVIATAFGFPKNLWTGPGDTRTSGVYRISDEVLLGEATINKTTDPLVFDQYIHSIDIPVELTAGVNYVVVTTIVPGDSVPDSDKTTRPKWAACLDEQEYSRYVYSDTLKFPTNSTGSDNLLTWNNVFLTAKV